MPRQVLREASISKGRNREYILSCLVALTKRARVYPQCYTLKGVTREIHPRAFGGYADVYQGKFEDKTLCVKAIRVATHQQDDTLTGNLSEMAIWAHLSHPNILEFYGVYIFDVGVPQSCFVSPWMENGNLDQYLKRRPEVPRMPLVLDVAEGVLYLHQSNVVHSDLKSENVLVSGEGRALIGDFGISNVVTSSGATFTESPNGTTRWMAPELYEGDHQATQLSDIWSLGCLFYKILTRKIPFYQYPSDTQALLAVIAGHIPVRPIPAVGCDSIDGTMWGLLERCWDSVPYCRPRCEEIRDIVVNLRIEDSRPLVLDRASNSRAFRKAVRVRSDFDSELNNKSLERVLLRIQREP
ncbi:kinase-like protein [Macrolepiota fuliginosa MF-IS2]|uniref:Kinase-like protein n=1 Tax=Macrolepiota fuliginosa MF-IS2 TaxID=1400762 RepID=A0A9P5XA23_9AGAR|nr:kinase-like protein [Macrolepiota fuliginosa MF-IS2]